MTTSTPRITASLSIDPHTYSFASPTALTLSLTFILHASEQITVFTYKSPFNPASALNQGYFPITDLTSSPPVSVPQESIRIQRMPCSRARGPSDEKYFLTLHPRRPVTVGIGFTSGGGGNVGRPQSKEVVERGRVIDKETG